MNVLQWNSSVNWCDLTAICTHLIEPSSTPALQHVGSCVNFGNEPKPWYGIRWLHEGINAARIQPELSILYMNIWWLFVFGRYIIFHTLREDVQGCQPRGRFARRKMGLPGMCEVEGVRDMCVQGINCWICNRMYTFFSCHLLILCTRTCNRRMLQKLIKNFKRRLQKQYWKLKITFVLVVVLIM